MANVLKFAVPGRSRYGAIADVLRDEIVSGRWASGALIPAETALMSQFGVALGTIRQAIAVLVDDGLLERKQGRGTSVCAGLSGASLLRFFRFGSRNAEGFDVPTSRILKRSVVNASADLAKQLNLKVGAKVIHILRTRSLNDEPRLLERIWIETKRFSAMVEGDTQAWGDLLYPEYAARCGVVVHRATETIQFGVLTATDAACLKLAPKHPCVVVSRVAYDVAGNAVEVRITRGDANAFQYSVELK
jgi:GntR family transcriptional regulator